jgi:hypothetical protein
MGGLKLMDRTVEQFHDLDQVQDAGSGPLELRSLRGDLSNEGLYGGITHGTFLPTPRCVCEVLRTDWAA